MIELPPPNTRRWVARRKAAVVAAVSSGMIPVEDACRRYQMSEGDGMTFDGTGEENQRRFGSRAYSRDAVARPLR